MTDCFSLRETAANWASRSTLTFGVAVLIAALFVSVAYIELDSSRRAHHDGFELVADGYATLLISTDEQLRPRLTSIDCDRVDDVRGVQASTWTTTAPPTRLWSRSGPELPTTIAGPRVVDIARRSTPSLATWDGGQVLIDRTSALATSRRSISADARSANGPVVATAISPADLGILGQGTTAGLVMVGLPPDRDVDSCIVLTELAHRTAVRTALQAGFPAEQGYQLQWALPNADRFTDPIDAYHDRPSRHIWIAATVAALVIIGFHLRLRRTDHAFYSIAGLSTRRLRRLILTDTLGIVLAAVAIAIVVMTIQTRRLDTTTPAVVNAAWAGLARTAVAVLISTIALCWTHATNTTERATAALKER